MGAEAEKNGIPIRSATKSTIRFCESCIQVNCRLQYIKRVQMYLDLFCLPQLYTSR